MLPDRGGVVVRSAVIGYRMFKGRRGIRNSDVTRKDGKRRMGKITANTSDLLKKLSRNLEKFENCKEKVHDEAHS